ncbi:ComF family protein [Gabonibacter chumensis]|uniref:ComF family protein n=1 Tax=Gabonibacter chumensis TaxID=2972474 RepID=UPI0025736B13|nr:phosphoribosyltransferase family protein [Gabonibacter chumensis]MCR9011559.1 phosphoribosyltransferase family protein [Gabonibacter chumensis]
MTLVSYFSAFVDLFYPRMCEVCKEVLVTGEKHICSACLYDFPYSYGLHDDLFLQFDQVCRMKSVYSLFYYSRYSDYRNLIFAVKYRSKRKVGCFLGAMLGERIVGGEEFDGIIPLPLHPKREKRRGFNQAREIAVGIAEVLQVPVMDHVVSRVVNNPSQTGLTVEQRAENVKRIFRLNEVALLCGKHILVVDDVITTGSTLTSFLKVLNEIPGLTVSVACLAVAKE